MWVRSVPDGDRGERAASLSAEGADDLANAALVYENQPVFLEMAVLAVVDVDLVWQVLADHHATALGESTGFGLDLTPEAAFEAWSGTTLALDGYLRAVSPEAAARVLSSATDFAEYTGNLAGIDSVFLTAFASAGRDFAATEPSLDHAGWVLDQFGMPSVPGGGAAHTFVSDAAHDRAALVDHDSLAAKIRDTDGNPAKIVDVLEREAVGVAAAASRSLIPGSGPYVKEAGKAVVSTGEGAAWGAAAGSLIGGPVGAAVGGVLGAIAGFVRWVAGPHDDNAAKDAAKGEKVPVSPPAPVTKDGHTTKVGADGTTTQGRPAPATPTPPPARPPGPKATEGHCPRGDDDTAPQLALPGWGIEYTLIPTLGPHGPGIDALIGGLGLGVLLPPPAQVSWEGDVAAAGLWGDLIIGERTAPGRSGGTRIVDRELFEKIARARYRTELAQALVLQTDPSATLYDALAMLRAGGPRRRVVVGEP